MKGCIIISLMPGFAGLSGTPGDAEVVRVVGEVVTFFLSNVPATSPQQNCCREIMRSMWTIRKNRAEGRKGIGKWEEGAFW